MLYVNAHLIFPGVIITRDNQPDNLKLKDLNNKKVAIVKSYVWNEYIQKDYPKIIIDQVKDLNTALKEVSFNNDYACIATLPIAVYYIKKSALNNLQLSGQTPYNANLSFTIRKDYVILKNILQKTLNSISQKEKDKILNKWIKLKSETLISKNALMIILLLILIIILAFIWNYSLKTLIKKKIIELKKEQENFKELFDKIPLSLCLLDINGNILYSNKYFLNIIGYTRQDCPNISDWWLKAYPDKKYREKVIKQWNQLIENAYKNKTNIEPKEYLIKCKNNKYRNMEISGMPIGKNNLVTFRDITNQKLLYEQLIQSEKLSAIGELTAGISHEFNNILAIIRANIQLLELEKNNNYNKELLESLQNIKMAEKRGAEIVSNLMNITSNKHITTEICKIENVIDEVIKLQQKQFELENIKIIKNYKSFKNVDINISQLHHVILNLIINARHAILPKKKGEISISTKTAKNKIIILISDNGIGMNDQIKKEIFTPFFTTKGSKSKDSLKIQGTGLGLSVSQNFISNNKGNITVKSVPNKGTTFKITLPIIN